MSTLDPVVALLARLNTTSQTVSEAYYQGRVHKSEDTARDIERLRQLRLLSPDIRDAFQLRASLRHFLNAALNTERLFSLGTNVGGYFQRLADLVEGHAGAYHEGRDADCERYEVEIREAISDIADAIDDELIVLHAQVSTRFADVATIAEKKRQNLHYQKRTQQLVNLLEGFHFADIGEQLAGHLELALAFKSLLADRIPAFRESLWSILDTLNLYLFEFRRIEERAKRLRAFALHLNRYPDWQPKAWDEVAEPAEWLCCASPLGMQAHPDVQAPASEALFSEIARSIPDTAVGRRRDSRPAGQVKAVSGNVTIAMPESPVRKAVRLYFNAAKQSVEGLSASAWWAANPELLGNLKEGLWIFRVIAEHDNKGKLGQWQCKVISRPHPQFNGNVLISDVVISKREA